MNAEEFKALPSQAGCETRRELAEQMGISKAPSSLGVWAPSLPAWAQKTLSGACMRFKLAEKEIGLKKLTIIKLF